MFDPDSIAPDQREDAIRIGSGFPSDKVLEQAKETLQACDKHGPKLANYGFGQPQIDELKERQEDLESMGVEKLKAKAKGGVTGTTLRTSEVQGKKARLVAKTVSEGGGKDLLKSGAEEDRKAASLVTETLARITPAGDDPLLLRNQLGLLETLLGQPEVAKVTALTGGPKAKQLVTDAIASLKAAEQAHKKGNPATEEQQLIDLLDGLIIDLVRRARKAARAASRMEEDPALAEAFKLDKLYN